MLREEPVSQATKDLVEERSILYPMQFSYWLDVSSSRVSEGEDKIVSSISEGNPHARPRPSVLEISLCLFSERRSE